MYNILEIEFAALFLICWWNQFFFLNSDCAFQINISIYLHKGEDGGATHDQRKGDKLIVSLFCTLLVAGSRIHFYQQTNRSQ